MTSLLSAFSSQVWREGSRQVLRLHKPQRSSVCEGKCKTLCGSTEKFLPVNINASGLVYFPPCLNMWQLRRYIIERFCHLSIIWSPLVNVFRFKQFYYRRLGLVLSFWQSLVRFVSLSTALNLCPPTALMNTVLVWMQFTPVVVCKTMFVSWWESGCL